MISQNLLFIPLTIFTLNNVKPLQPQKEIIQTNQNYNTLLTKYNWVGGARNSTDAEDIEENQGNIWTRTKRVENLTPTGMQIERTMVEIYNGSFNNAQTGQIYSYIVSVEKITQTNTIYNPIVYQYGYGGAVQGMQSTIANYRPKYRRCNVEYGALSHGEKLMINTFLNNNPETYNNSAIQVINYINSNAVETLTLATGDCWTVYSQEEGNIYVSNGNYYKELNTSTENTWVYLEYYVEYYNPSMMNNYITDPYSAFTNVYSELQYKYTVDIETGSYEIIDIPTLLFSILTMPFAFISQAFNLTLFPNTMYAVNVGNLFLAIIGVSILIIVIRIIFTLKG